MRRWLVGLMLATGLGIGAVFWTLGTSDPSFDGAPAWSPDGRRIVFAVERGAQSDVWIMNADGSGRAPLLETSSQETSPAIAPDGKRIAFETDLDGNVDIVVMNLDGSGMRRLTSHPAGDHAPAWSPDGRMLAFVSERSGGDARDVYVMNADGSGVRRLTDGGQYWAPQFSPNGTEIAAQGGRDVYLIAVATGARRRLTYDPQNGMSPTWSNSGTRLAFASTRRARLELFTTDVDGSNQDLLLSMPGGSAMDPRWSPDGTHIAFVYVPQVDNAPKGAPQPYAIYMLEVATKKVTRVSR